MHKIEKESTWIMASNGMGVIHGPIQNNEETVTETGLCCFMSADTKEELLDIFCDSWENEEVALDATKVNITSVCDVLWSVEYSEAEADAFCSTLCGEVEGLCLCPQKHPDRDEWAVPFQPNIFDKMADGPTKDALEGQHQDSINAGMVKTIQEMTNEGWK